MDTIRSTSSGVSMTDQTGAFVGTGAGSGTPKAYLAGIICPRFDAPVSEKLEWLQASAARGRAFLAAQPGFDFITSAAMVLQGLMPKDQANSEHNLNYLKRQIREIIATLGNLKPEWRYGSPANDAKYIEQVVKELNDRLKVWWKGDTFPAAAIKKALQFAATGCGYIHPAWSLELLGSDQSDIELKVYGPEDVLIDQITDDWDLDKAYAVSVYERVPTVRLRQLWPEQENNIFPNVLSLTDEGARGTGLNPTNGVRGGWKSTLFGMIGMGGNGITDNKQTGGAGRQLRTKISHNQTLATDVYVTYINDTSANMSGQVVWARDITVTDQMHQLNDVGDYPIPPVGVAVQIGRDKLVQPKVYPVQRCLLYPARRVIVWTQDAVLYDGPSFYHHGKVPLVKLQFDPQVWNYLGGNPVQENLAADRGFGQVLGTWHKMFRLRANPPVEFDTSEISEKEMQKRDLYAEGAKYPRKGMSTGAAIKPIHPHQHLQIGNEALELLQYTESRLNHNLGTNDFQSLMKMQAIVDGDGLEKLMAALGPMLSDYASYLEMTLTKLGYLCMWTWLQFNTSAVKASRGEMLLSSELDLAPGTSIPVVIQGADELTNSCFFYRMRYIAKRLRFSITPDSVFQVTDWKRKMLALQLYREPNFPMDSKTIAEVLGLDGFGDIEGDTIIERWANEREMMLKYQGRLQNDAMTEQMIGQAVAQVKAQFMAQMTATMMQQGTGIMQTPEQMAALDGQEIDGNDPFYGALGALVQGQGLGTMEQLQEQLGASNTVGRPPTGQAVPQIETKTNGDGSERQTITES